MCEILMIHGIDLALLETQRVCLISVLSKIENDKWFTREEVDAVSGILNMLDSWSDEQLEGDRICHTSAI